MRRVPDLVSYVGLVGAIGFVIGTIVFEAKSVQEILVFFWSPGAHAAWFIVIGGTLMATAAAFTAGQLVETLKLLPEIFMQKKYNLVEMVEKASFIAGRVKQEGLRQLEDISRDEDLPVFLQNFADYASVVMDSKKVKNYAETYTEIYTERYKVAGRVLDFAAMCAPAFGLIGAVTGLVRTLVHLEDPSKVGPGVALAFVATFYGILVSYGIFTPLKNKIEMRMKEELFMLNFCKEIIVEIMENPSPTLIREKLKMYLPEGAKIEEGATELI